MQQLPVFYNQPIYLAPFSKTNTLVTLENESKLYVLDKSFKKVASCIEITNGAIKSINFSSDNATIYLLSTQDKLLQYRLPSFELLASSSEDVDDFLLSQNGRFILISNATLHRLTILDAKTLKVIKQIPTVDKKGALSTINNIYHAPKRYSFIISFVDSPQLWEIPYSDEAGVEIFKGWAHDYRKDGGEGKVEQWQLIGEFAVRKVNLDFPAKALTFDNDNIDLIVAYKDQLYYDVINLDTKKQVTSLRFQQVLDIKKSVSWRQSNGASYLAIATIKGDELVIIDSNNWAIHQTIKLKGKISALSTTHHSSDILIAIQQPSGCAELVMINKTRLTIKSPQ